MKKKSSKEFDDELRREYDLRELLAQGVRGKYAARYRAGSNVVLLAPDVAKAFPNEAAVNEALRLVIQLGQLQSGRRRRPTSSARAGRSALAGGPAKSS